MMPYLALMRRDLRLSFSRGAEGMTTVFFFVMTVSLFPFALGGEPALLQRTGPAILWVSAVLAALLSLETIYHRDEEDGTFDLLLLSPVSPFGLVLTKMATHWIISGLTLALISAVMSQMLFIAPAALLHLLPSLLIGTLYMSLLGGMGAILTFGTKRPGLLLSLLILPLYIPMLLLGVMGMEAALAGLPAKAYLLLQLALVIAALPLTAGAAAVMLRMHLRS